MKFNKVSDTFYKGEVFEVIQKSTGALIGYVRSRPVGLIGFEWDFSLAGDSLDWDSGYKTRCHAADRCRRAWNAVNSR